MTTPWSSVSFVAGILVQTADGSEFVLTVIDEFGLDRNVAQDASSRRSRVAGAECSDAPEIGYWGFA